MKLWLSVIFLITVCSGCVTVGDINDGMQRIDRIWQAEYQKTEDEFRCRVVDCEYSIIFKNVRATLLEMGFTIDGEEFKKGIISVSANGPCPLTKEEWERVADYEQPRVKEMGGWYFDMHGDPKTYVISADIIMVPLRGKAVIRLDYSLSNPKYERMGITPAKHAPPLAVQLASVRFWNILDKKLKFEDLPKLRRRTKSEMSEA
jgi:hypothetical protein